MNRKEILKEINYKGEYNKEVKKNLKALLKKYHPDHYKKESDTFKLINSIKKDLEDGKKVDVIDEVHKESHPKDYSTYEEILELSEKRDRLVDRKAKYQKELEELYKKYQIEYDKEIKNRNTEFDNSSEVIELQDKRRIYNILLISTTLLIMFLIFTKLYYPLIITIILFVYVVYHFINIDVKIQKILERTSNNLKKSSVNIAIINEKIADLNKKVWDLDIEINRLQTRINLLNAKIR